MEVGGNYVGLDLGKRTYEMCIIAPKGKITRTGGKTDKAGLAKLCDKLGADDAVAMEACDLAFRLGEQIRKSVGCKVYILNPKRLAIIYASTRKTDKEDSLKLSKLLRTHGEDELPIVTPPTKEELERRRLLSEYKSLKRQRTREINRLHAIFEHNGYTQFTRKNMITEESRSKILPLLKGYEKGEAERLVERLTVIEKQIAELYEKIKAEVESDKNVQKAMTVPGVGSITALAYVSYIGDLNRFENAHQVSNFIGFVPKVDMSCTIVRYGHITRNGNPYLRSLLVQAAWALVRSKKGGALKEKYKYMAETRCIGRGKSIVTIARKLGELLYMLLKTGREYEPKRFITPETKVQGLADTALKCG